MIIKFYALNILAVSFLLGGIINFYQPEGVQTRDQESDNTIRVAVLDTGLNRHVRVPLCSEHPTKNFTKGSISSNSDHGSNVAELIHRYSKGADYCQTMVKYYESPTDFNMVDSLRWVVNNNFNIVVIASSGEGEVRRETKLIKTLLDSGVRVLVAAGNERLNFDISCSAFPACIKDPRLEVVGCKDKYGSICDFSNFGEKVQFWENGLEQRGGGLVMSGTSQSTAIRAGKVIRELYGSL